MCDESRMHGAKRGKIRSDCCSLMGAVKAADYLSLLQKYAIFSKALDVVGQADPELPGKILSGTFKISHENLVALSKMPAEEIRRIGARPENHQRPFTSYSDTRKEFLDKDEESVDHMEENLPLIKVPPSTTRMLKSPA